MTLQVSIPQQDLTLFSDEGEVLLTAPCSTASAGPGFTEGSYQTPTGLFQIREKIGEGAPLHTIFKGRRPCGIWNGEAAKDAILTRILRLDGLEKKNANTWSRYIYFHGTHAEDQIGTPASHGCIRLKNLDMLKLFDSVSLGTQVQIRA